MGADTDDTTIVEVLGCVFRHVGNIGGKLFHTAFGFAHFEGIFVDVYRGKDIVAHHTFIEHNGVLVVITLPWHECHLEVTAKSEFTVFGGVAFCEDVALYHTLTGAADRTQVDSSALVGFAEFWQTVNFQRVFKCHKFFFFGTVIANADFAGVDILNHTGAFSGNLSARVADKLTFDTCTYDRSLAAQQGHCLSHHVRTHERAVGVVVLQEGDERCGYRGNL